MATLHVRGVPDRLYERLRRRARVESRSIGSETVVLLNGALEREASRDANRRLLQGIRRRREQRVLRTGIPDSVELLREDRAR